MQYDISNAFVSGITNTVERISSVDSSVLMISARSELMQCECGKEIINVPERLLHVVKWQCKECGRNIDTTGHKIRPEQIASEQKARKKAA